jgi:peptide/nickel transport system substrate-binding protein
MVLGLVLVITATACAAPAQQPRQSTADGGGAPGASAAPKRITVAINGNLRAFYSKIDQLGSGSTPGNEEVEELVNAGLTNLDENNVRKPLLAEAVPSLENGLLKVLPDGRMEMTWRIKAGALWHDGTPFTTDDLLFTGTLIKDAELAVLRDLPLENIESMEALDPRTLVVTWRRPYADADTLFSRGVAQPLPKHLIEPAYLENKASVVELPYWNREFVGTGPFRLREYSPGSYAVFEANDRYILGRPKIDELELRFIPDRNTMVANVLSGTVQLTMGRGLAIDEGVQIRDQWREGSVDVGPLRSWIALYPQFINPNPPMMQELPFRRAMVQAIDRAQLVDELAMGLTAVADAIISPRDAEYPRIESRIVKYSYDPRAATSALEGLGFTRGTDGVLRDSTGQQLVVPAQTSQGAALQEKAALAVADYWQRLGIKVELDVIPTQARTDRARRAGRPGFEIQKQQAGATALVRYTSGEVPLPENNYSGNNRARYANPAFDALLEGYFTTITRADRDRILGDIVNQMTDQAHAMGVLWDADPVLRSARTDGVRALSVPGPMVTFNAHEWTLK